MFESAETSADAPVTGSQVADAGGGTTPGLTRGGEELDGHNFDSITRLFGNDSSRRQVLRRLGAGALGGVAALVGRGVDATPQCRGQGHPCEGNQICCTGLACVEASGNGQAERCCPSGYSACGTGEKGTCCPSGKVCCNGQCKKGTSCTCTPNCNGKTCGDDGCGGSCGTCGEHQACKKGYCACAKGYKKCGERCIPLTACCEDKDCGTGRICYQGKCKCAEGYKPCGKRCIPTGACCTDKECDPYEDCKDGRCVCAKGYKPCGDTCIPVKDCCPEEGSCCQPGYKECDGVCIPDNACCTDGDCTGEHRICYLHKCKCADGYKDCDGTCIPIAQCCTNNNCEACEICDKGICVDNCRDDEECIDGICESTLHRGR